MLRSRQKVDFIEEGFSSPGVSSRCLGQNPHTLLISVSVCPVSWLIPSQTSAGCQVRSYTCLSLSWLLRGFWTGCNEELGDSQDSYCLIAWVAVWVSSGVGTDDCLGHCQGSCCEAKGRLQAWSREPLLLRSAPHWSASTLSLVCLQPEPHRFCGHRCSHTGFVVITSQDSPKRRRAVRKTALIANTQGAMCVCYAYWVSPHQ